jgi:hypothetical protein
MRPTAISAKKVMIGGIMAADKVRRRLADLRQPAGALRFERVSWVAEELVWVGKV